MRRPQNWCQCVFDSELQLTGGNMGTYWIYFTVIFSLFTFIFPASAVPVASAGGLKYIGRLTPRKHKVSGEVYAVDERTLHIRGFTYDGTGPDAFFWTGVTERPSPQGIIVPNERGTKEVLGAYHGQDITISLPDGLTLRDVKWFAVWCRAYEVNFGDVYIPQNLDFTQPHAIGSLVGLAPQYLHGSSPVYQVSSVGHQPQNYIQTQPVAQAIPQHQYYHYIDSPKAEYESHTVGITAGSTGDIHTDSSHYRQPALVTINSQPSIVNNQIHTGAPHELIYSTPLNSASKVTPVQHVNGLPLGSNGYSSFTIRTSKGSSTALSLY